MTEDKPHVVYPKAPDGTYSAFVAPTYREAHQIWSMWHSSGSPWLIATLGRTIDPSAHIVDPNE